MTQAGQHPDGLIFHAGGENELVTAQEIIIGK